MYLVTSIDEAFYPALVALRNSVLCHSPETRLACLTYGDDSLAEKVAALGVEVRHNVAIGAYLPPGEHTKAGCQPMYARLLAPLLFGDCVWLDADQIVLRDMRPLLDLRFKEPLAAVPCHRNSIANSVIGMEKPPKGDSIYSGLMVFNAAEYKRLKITEQCLRLMDEAEHTGIVYRFVVQSVLSVVLADKFYRLDERWQGFANRSTVHPESWWVLHWHGRKRKPWNTPDIANRDIWRKYACMYS